MHFYNHKMVLASLAVALLSAAQGVGAAPVVSAMPTPQSAVKDKLPWVVFIYSTNCPMCARARISMMQLEPAYKSKAHFVKLDITNDRAVRQSRKLAKAMNLGPFFAKHQYKCPCVAVFTSDKKHVQELLGRYTKNEYIASIDTAIQKSR